MDAINKFFGGIKDFVVDQGENPVFWLILFFAGLGIFLLVYSALHRNH